MYTGILGVGAGTGVGGFWVPPRAWAWAPIYKEEGIAMLEEQAKILEYELESIRNRLEQLKKQEVKNA